MWCNKFTKQVFPKFLKLTPAILPAMHEVKQCTLSRTFWHYTYNEASANATSQSGCINYMTLYTQFGTAARPE